MVAKAPSSVATLPQISAMHKSTFSGSEISVENPSKTVMTLDQRDFSITDRAFAATAASASIAYTFPAPSSAAMMANSANGPVPKSNTTLSSPKLASLSRIASRKIGVRVGSSFIALYADISNETKFPPFFSLLSLLDFSPSTADQEALNGILFVLPSAKTVDGFEVLARVIAAMDRAVASRREYRRLSVISESSPTALIK
mmetsp:Transcript_29206/g.44153  ORF Transcript_29206/g.44153 Transcript_29206/m.44153 type:complete len:201 (+) Transcript_29206:829-1431(+)